MAKSGLGTGLGEVLSSTAQMYETDFGGIDDLEMGGNALNVEDIELERIVPNPYQPRKHFDQEALKDLSNSILRHGLLQPIVVIEHNGDYMLIAGERRLRAHKLANLKTIKAIIAEVDMDELRMRELALIENIQRENLNAVELAKSYKELLEVHEITHEELATIVHKSRSQITNTLRLLKLDEAVQEMVVDGRLTQGHAKTLINLEQNRQKIAAQSIVGQKMSVREAENLVRKLQGGSSTSKPKADITNPYKEELKELLGSKISIGANSVKISFGNTQEIEEFIALIKR